MIYEESAEILASIDDAQAGRITKSLCRYYLTGEKADLEDPLEQAILNGLILKEARHQKKYEKICEENTAKAKKRWKADKEK